MLFFLPLRKSAISCWILSTVWRLTWHILQRRRKNYSESFGHVSEPWKTPGSREILDKAKKTKLIWQSIPDNTSPFHQSPPFHPNGATLPLPNSSEWCRVWKFSLVHLFLLDGSTGISFFFWGVDLCSFSGTSSFHWAEGKHHAWRIWCIYFLRKIWCLRINYLDIAWLLYNIQVILLAFTLKR